MSGLEFASTTIGQLIWPVAAVVIALVLRRPLKALAGTSRIRELEAGPNGIKLAFDAILDDAEQAAVVRPKQRPEREPAPEQRPEREPEPLQRPEQEPEREQRPEPEPERNRTERVRPGARVMRPGRRDVFDVDGFHVRMKRIADRSPRAAVVESFTHVETMLRHAISLNTEPGQNRQRHQPPRQMAAQAVDLGILSPFEGGLLGDLSAMRNLVAHEAEKVIPEGDALRYIGLAELVLNAIISGPDDAARVLHAQHDS